MHLSHLSASSIKTWQACTAQWADRYVNKTSQGPSGAAADLGTAIHETLEGYVKAFEYVLPGSWAYLLARWQEISQAKGLPSKDEQDGYMMLLDWHARQDWTDREVVSTEQEWSFELTTKYGPITVKFIIDRVDRVDGELEIDDYKSGRWQLNHDQLRGDVQAKTYATACWLEYPNQSMYWVTFDYLRDEPVSVGFRSEELKAHYEWLVALAEQIIETDESQIGETINSGCRFCHRQFKCQSLRNVNTSLFPASMELEHVATHRIELYHAAKAIESMIGDLDRVLRAAFEEDDTLPGIRALGASSDSAVTLGSTNQRYVDLGVIRRVLTAEELAAYAKPGVKDVEELAKYLTPDRAAELKKALRAGKTKQGIKIIAANSLL